MLVRVWEAAETVDTAARSLRGKGRRGARTTKTKKKSGVSWLPSRRLSPQRRGKFSFRVC